MEWRCFTRQVISQGGEVPARETGSRRLIREELPQSAKASRTSTIHGFVVRAHMPFRHSLPLLAVGAVSFAAGMLCDRQLQTSRASNTMVSAHADVSRADAQSSGIAPGKADFDAAAAKRARSERSEVTHSIASRLHEAMESKDALRQMSKLMEMADALTADEIAAAVELAGKMPPGSGTNGALAILFARWAGLDPREALDFALRMDAAHRDQAVQSIVYTMAGSDPAAAFDLFDSIPPDQRPNAMWTIFPAWARSAPDAAARTAAQLPDGDERNSALLCVASQWASTDPGAAIAWIRSLSEGTVRDDTLMKAVTQNPTGVAEFLLDLPAGDLQSRAFRQIAIQWAQNDVVAALEWATQLPPGTAQQEALASVVSEWGTRDAPAAAEYASQLPAGDTQERALRNVMLRWAANDPVGAADWLDQMPAGASRDAAITSLTSKIRSQSPEIAAAWAQSISNESIRSTEVEQIVRTWMRTDATGARKWLGEANAVAPDVKRRLLGQAGLPPAL